MLEIEHLEEIVDLLIDEHPWTKLWLHEATAAVCVADLPSLTDGRGKGGKAN